MSDLGFKIVRTSYPARSGMTGVVIQKIRDDGRVGAVVGDEAKLWDALQETQTRLASALQAIKDLERERDELRGQLEYAQKGRRR